MKARSALPQPKTKTKSKKKKKGVQQACAPLFKPFVEFYANPIILTDKDLRWTERFKTGMFAFHNGQLGISFKEAHKGLFVEGDDGRYYLEIDRAYVKGAPKTVKVPADTPKALRNYFKYISCLHPSGPCTFFPLDVPENQQQVMQQLLAIAQVVEELLEAEGTDIDDVRCDEARSRLNELYDNFVEEYGFIQNCKSYFDGFWSDVRLQVYLLELEDKNGCKADIFRRRLKHPPKPVSGQLFDDDDLNTRIHKAFVWCMGRYGTVLVSEVAEKAGVDEGFAIASLLEQGLVYREWLGTARQEWYEILGVEPDCTIEELRTARKELAKQYHPDTGSASELMMKRVNNAFDEGLAELQRKAVAA